MNHAQYSRALTMIRRRGRWHMTLHYSPWLRFRPLAPAMFHRAIRRRHGPCYRVWWYNGFGAVVHGRWPS